MSSGQQLGGQHVQRLMVTGDAVMRQAGEGQHGTVTLPAAIIPSSLLGPAPAGVPLYAAA